MCLLSVLIRSHLSINILLLLGHPEALHCRCCSTMHNLMRLLRWDSASLLLRLISSILILVSRGAELLRLHLLRPLLLIFYLHVQLMWLLLMLSHFIECLAWLT